jgi:c-di-GMP-binding flagellar brake protein YcgR
MAQDNEQNLESFEITTKREIIFYLRQLINDGDRVSLMFGEGQETMLTVLLDVDEDEGELLFDWGASENVNQKLLASKRTFFVASPGGVRNQFITANIWKTTYKGRPAFSTDIPARYVRMQRREFFRLTLPFSRRPQCTFQWGEPKKAWNMTVVDIGLGGVALEVEVQNLPFELTQVVPKATVDLKTHGKLEVDLEVRFRGNVDRGIKHFGRLGCRFVKLSNAQQNVLQRFVTEIQREERAAKG